MSGRPDEKERAVTIKLDVGNTEPIGGDTLRSHSTLESEFRANGFEKKGLEFAERVRSFLVQKAFVGVEKERRAIRGGQVFLDSMGNTNGLH